MKRSYIGMQKKTRKDDITIKYKTYLAHVKFRRRLRFRYITGKIEIKANVHSKVLVNIEKGEEKC
jgi:hypothetical protein